MDDEELETAWFPALGEKVLIACDWTMAMGQIGEVVKIEPSLDQFGEIDGAVIFVQFEDGSQDEFEIEDLQDTLPHPCAYNGCGKLETHEYQSPPEPMMGGTAVDRQYLCVDHATELGYCNCCGEFCADNPGFEQQAFDGMCDNCREELEADEEDDAEYDSGLFDEYDDDYDEDDDFDDYDYNESWYDPKSAVSDLEPDDTPRARFIGAGSQEISPQANVDDFLREESSEKQKNPGEADAPT